MAIESIDIPVGMPLPDFSLSDPDGKAFDSMSLAGPKGLLIIFTCNHCPYARAVWPRTIELAGHARSLGIHTIAINSNIHPQYPDDAPEMMKKYIVEWKIPFPYLVDESQDVARTFRAQCTPDIYLFGPDRTLQYHGRVDDNWQDASKVTKHELREAIDAVAAGRAAAERQHPTIGCSIKWRT